MNALLFIFFIAYFFYSLYNNIRFIFIYVTFMAIYHFLTQVKFFRTDFNKGRRKILISSWNTPYDPQSLVKLKLDITKTEKYLEDISTKEGEKITLTVHIIKLMSIVLKKYPEFAGYIRFGKVNYEY